MKTTVCVIGTILALAIAAPAAAQDNIDANVGWAPWAERVDAPAPQVRSVQVATKVVAEAPAQDTFVRRLLRIDRFWVVGSFR